MKLIHIEQLFPQKHHSNKKKPIPWLSQTWIACAMIGFSKLQKRHEELIL
jgi:hypothetical protein